MNPELERAKERYHSVEPPEELAFAVATAVRAGDQARRSRHALRRSLGTALASCACFVLLVNTSPTFAQAVYEVPVLGRLARIFTVAEYQIEDQEHLIDVRLPALENTGHTALEQRINTEISTRIQSLLDEAEERARSARAAYIATGGEAEDFMPVIIDVDYEIKCQNDRYLSFLITETETQATAFQQLYPYSIDLESGKELTLRDLLGPDWKEIVNASVREQISQRSQDPDHVYWGGDDYSEAFTSIRDNQPFYLNEAGRPVVLFEKYEIAPGYMGVQEFEIPS